MGDFNFPIRRPDPPSYERDHVALEEYLATTQSAIDTLETDVATLESDVGTLQTDLGTAESDINDIETILAREDTDWTDATLYNSWVNYGGGYATAGYLKDLAGVVHVRGMVKSGTVTNGTRVLWLPSDMRPEQAMFFLGYTSGGGVAMTVVNTDGQVDTGWGYSATHTSLNFSFWVGF